MKKIVMVGTHRDTMGGVSSVVRVLEAGGLFDRCGIHYIASHADGSARHKLVVASRAWFGFLRMVIKRQVSLLHVHLSSRASFWRKLQFIWLARLAGIPVVVHLHGAEFRIFTDEECGPIGRRLVRFVFDGAAAVLVLSESWKAWVDARFPGAKSRVLYNPVMPVRHRALTSASGRVLFLGRLGQRKGVAHLIAAAANVTPLVPDLELWLGGDGDPSELRARAAALGLGQQTAFLGWVSGEEKHRRLSEAAVFVLPSYNEGLPMAVLEAMAYGLPVISTPVGGIPEAITDGVEGYLVAPGDEATLADRLSRLLRDAGLRHRMGAAGRAKVESKFSAATAVAQLEALYADVLRNRSGAGPPRMDPEKR
jgi:glycosyltransferase involved in cell wall biosynthesis